MYMYVYNMYECKSGFPQHFMLNSFISDGSHHHGQYSISSERVHHSRDIRSLYSTPSRCFENRSPGKFKILSNRNDTYQNETIRVCYDSELTNKMSCKGRCGKRTKLLNLKNDLEVCNCDDACQRYQDCCYDHKKHCKSANPMSILGSHECITVPNMANGKYRRDTTTGEGLELYERQNMFMITGCLKDDTKKDIRIRCEEPVLDRLDITEFIPVSMAIKGEIVTFRNKFCAMCNSNYSEGTVENPWKSEIKCNDTVDFRKKFLTFNHTEKLEFILKNKTCALFLKPYIPVKSCTKKIVSKCNTSLSDVIPNFNQLATACESYMGIISILVPTIFSDCGNVLYKNTHCALCNGVEFHDLQCDYGRVTLAVGGFIPPSFSLLMDFSQNDLQLTFNNKPFSQKDCGESETYTDGECRPKACSSGYIEYNSECIALINSKTQPQPDGFQSLTVEAEVVVEMSDGYQTPSDVAYSFKTFFPALVLHNLYLPDDSKIDFQIERIERPELTFRIRQSIMVPDMIHPITTALGATERIVRLNFYVLRRVAISYTVSYVSIHNYNQTDKFSCQIGELMHYAENDTKFVYPSELGAETVYVKERSEFYNPKNILFSMSTMSGKNVNVSVCEMRNDGCTYRQLDANEYVESNDSITVIQSGESLDKSQYVKIGKTVFICEPNVTGHNSEYLSSNYSQGILTLVGGSVSLIALAFTIITYCSFKSLRTVPGRNLLNMMACLFFGQLLQLAGMNRTGNKIVCTVIAAVMHFLWLSCFTWMSIIAFHTSKVFRKMLAWSREDMEVHFRYYVLVAYSIPLAIVSTCVGLHFGAPYAIYAENDLCWISNSLPFIAAFLVPISISLLCNFVWFIGATYALFSAQRDSSLATNNRKSDFCRSLIYFKLSTLMGFSWIFGYLAIITQIEEFWYPFIVFSTLQGLLVSLAFTMNKGVCNLYRGCLKPQPKNEIGTKSLPN